MKSSVGKWAQQLLFLVFSKGFMVGLDLQKGSEDGTVPMHLHAVSPNVNLFPIATLVRVHLSQLMNHFVVFSRSLMSL